MDISYRNTGQSADDLGFSVQNSVIFVPLGNCAAPDQWQGFIDVRHGEVDFVIFKRYGITLCRNRQF